MLVLYNLFIQLYLLGIRLAALGNNKAAQWLAGRKNLWQQLQQALPQKQPLIWVHSASAGEFEQAKPVIEGLKKDFPQYKILVTFFSPSGYHIGKKSPLADYVFYLPLDTAKNAKRFINTLDPKLVVFVKYDYWYHHLKAVHDRQIPLILVSAIFRQNQTFFKWYGAFYKKMLHFFTQLFVQDEYSKKLLQQNGITHSTVSGDTRFDRVATIASNFTPIPEMETIIAGKKVMIAGSTWPEDEEMLQKAFADLKDVKLVIAPHEINSVHIKGIQQLFVNSITYSELKKNVDTSAANLNAQNVSNPFYGKQVLIYDNFGMLSRLYQYATVTYIGGGFNKSGIHNTLEAAVWGKPVVWGPHFKKFREAKDLLNVGGGFTYEDATALKGILNILFSDADACAKAGHAAAAYVQQNRGATQKIITYIQENRLLTNA